MSRSYSTIEKNLLAILLAHFKDALIAVKTDVVSRKALQMVPATKQDGFSINQLWDETFVAERLRMINTTPAPKTTEKEATTPVDTSAASLVAASTLDDVCFDELTLNKKDEAKVPLTTAELTKDWTVGIDGTEEFVRIGKDFIHDLQTHLKERNPNAGLTSLTFNLDHEDGPIPQFYSLMTKIIKSACSCIETMPLRSHYLLLLVRYTINNVVFKEKTIVTGWNQSDASKSLKSMLVKLDEDHLIPMDARVRQILADAHAPELVRSLRKKDENIRAKLVQLLFTLFYQGDNQRNKSKEFLEKTWKDYQAECKNAVTNEEEPPEISLTFLMAIIQIQASKSLLLEEETNEINQGSPELEAQPPTDDDYSSGEEDALIPAQNQTELALTNAQHSMETIYVQKGKKLIPVQMDPNNALMAPKLTAQENIKISNMITQACSVQLRNISMNISGKDLSAQQLADWGLIDPQSIYFKGEKNLKMRMLPNRKTRERSYCALLDPNSGIPIFIIDHEVKILHMIRDGNDGDQKDLLIANWQLVWSYFFHYCLNSEQLMLTEHTASAAGEWGLFLILAGPTHAGFKLTNEAVSRLTMALDLLEQAVKSYMSKTIKSEHDLPEKWHPHLISSLGIFRELIKDLNDMNFILKDLEAIATQWRIKDKDNTKKMKELFETYEETINRNARVASQEFLSQETSSEINFLIQSQDRYQRARKINEFADEIRSDKQPISSRKKQDLLEHGISGGRDQQTHPFFPGDVLQRDNLTLTERKQALENAESRAKALAELGKEMDRFKALQEQLVEQEKNVKRIKKQLTQGTPNNNNTSATGSMVRASRHSSSIVSGSSNHSTNKKPKKMFAF